MRERISILIADSTRMSGQLLCEALRRDRAFSLLRPASTASELMAGMGFRPHVVLISSMLEEDATKGFTLLRQITRTHPDTAAVILLDSSKPSLVVEAFRSGARGVFCRAESVRTLAKCINSVRGGQIWANSAELRNVTEALADSGAPRLVDAKGNILLSEREQDVVRCVAEGLTNRDIAARLMLSEHTVKNYIFRIFEKLSVSTRVELVLYAFSQRRFAQEAQARVPLPNYSSTSDIEQCRQAAAAGNVTAQIRLGELYSEGGGEGRDVVSALTWLFIAEGVAAAMAKRAEARADALIMGTKPEISEKAQQCAAEWLRAHDYPIPQNKASIFTIGGLRLPRADSTAMKQFGS